MLYEQAISHYIAIRDFAGAIHAMNLQFICIDDNYFDFEHTVLDKGFYSISDITRISFEIMQALPNCKLDISSETYYDDLYYPEVDWYSIYIYAGKANIGNKSVNLKLGFCYNNRVY